MEVERGSGGTGTCHFLDHDGTEQEISPGAAVFLRHTGAEQPTAAGLMP